jgi:MFS family permease
VVEYIGNTGYISDKIGRKFGMMTATGIVALFSLLSATIKGVNGDLHSMLSQLAAWRYDCLPANCDWWSL